ncbi:hypothetical protein VTH06DRAFT_1937 [Thermothelomyces fergusii]
MAPSSPTDPEPPMDTVAYVVLGLKVTAETIMFLAFGPTILFACFTTTLAAVGLAAWVVYVYAEAIVDTISGWLDDWMHPNKYRMYDEQTLAEIARQLADPQPPAPTESSMVVGSSGGSIAAPSTRSSSSQYFPPVSRYLGPGDAGPRRRRSTTVATAPNLDEQVDGNVDDEAETRSYSRRFSGVTGPPPSWLNRRWGGAPRLDLAVPPVTAEEVECLSPM